MVSAQVIQGQKPLRRGELAEIRRGKTEVFFDFEGAQDNAAIGEEGDGLEPVNYLIGAVHRMPDTEGEYTAFFADKFDDEDENLVHFLEWADSFEDPIFYHWHRYEHTHLTKMVERYGVDLELAAAVLDRLEDLPPWATKGYAFPAYGEGLKPMPNAWDSIGSRPASGLWTSMPDMWSPEAPIKSPRTRSSSTTRTIVLLPCISTIGSWINSGDPSDESTEYPDIYCGCAV